MLCQRRENSEILSSLIYIGMTDSCVPEADKLLFFLFYLLTKYFLYDIVPCKYISKRKFIIRQTSDKKVKGTKNEKIHAY